MCFDATKTLRAKIAKKDIICWKVLAEDNFAYCRAIKGVKFQYFVNQLTDTVCLKRNRLDYLHEATIVEGYHSFKTEYGADNDINENDGFHLPPCEKHKFIIPEGAKYYENDKEYVSSTIMLID